MVLERWDPFRELRRMEETVDRLWRGLGPRAGESGGVEAWAIPLDVMREGDNIIVHASLPGVRPSDITVSIEDGVLTIEGHTAQESEHKEANYLMRERRLGSFHRSLRLPDTVDANLAHSTYENGVLTISVPKAEDKKARQLTVEVKDSGQSALSSGASRN
jgi:HSP20 family protein